MNPYYNRKLQQCLIDTGKKVERQIVDKTPSIPDIEILFDKLLQAVETGDMKSQSVTSGELIAGLVKWRVEKL